VTSRIDAEAIPVPKWTERSIGGLVVRELFQRRVLAVPNCSWTGYECDLLVVEPGLRLIDVEIKISRSDLLADPRKDKWWRSAGGLWHGSARQPRDWPPQVWKHYYVMPAAVWEDGCCMLPAKSGIVLIHEHRDGRPYLKVLRRCRVNPDAKPIDHVQAINIARLAGLRMWDALRDLDRSRNG